MTARPFIVTEYLLESSNSTVIPSKELLGTAIVRSGHKKLWGDRPADTVIDTLVVHYMSAMDMDPKHALELPSVLAVFPHFGVSAHYLIMRNGEVIRLVPEKCRAWHAGGSIMPYPDDRTNVNHFSIGVELLAAPDQGYTAAQYCSLGALAADIMTRHPLKVWVGHNEIAGQRAVSLGLRLSPKVDPGDLFDWHLADNAAKAAGININLRSSLPEGSSSNHISASVA